MKYFRTKKEEEGYSQPESSTTLVCIELRAVPPNQSGVHHCSTSGDN
jgi:hypothetical protein